MVPKPLKHSFRHILQFGPHGLLIPIRWPTGCPSLRTICFNMFHGSNLTRCSFPACAP